NRSNPATSPTNADTLTYLVTFDEAVTGLTASNFSVSGTTATIGTPSTSNGGTSWSVSLSVGDLASLNATVELDLANNTSVFDIAGNDLTTTTFPGHTYLQYYPTPPSSDLNRSNPATSPTNADTLTYLVTFSEIVTGLTASNFSVSGTTATIG